MKRKGKLKFLMGSLLLISLLVTGCSQLFTEKYEVNLKTDDKAGEIKLSPLGGEYKEGKVVTVKAVPAENYVFKSWAGDLTGSEQQQTIKVTEALTIQAKFDGKPVFKNLKNKEVTVDEKLTFQVQPEDPEGKEVTLEVRSKPQGAEFVSETGEFSWQPAANALGEHQVTFLASDGELTNRETITIEVSKKNQPPVVKGVSDRVVTETNKLAFQVEATDLEEAEVTFGVKNKPPAAKFDSQSGRFSWQPNYQAAGSYEVTFTATDGKLKSEKTITIKVKNKNQAPVLKKIGNKQIAKDEELNFTVQANDPDGDSVQLKVKNKPLGAEFNSVTGEFNWQPDYHPVGNYEATFIASDGDLSMQETIVISVGDVNSPPEAKEDVGTTVQGEKIKLDLLANDQDPDSDQLSIKQVTNGEYGEVTNKEKGTVIYQPEADYTGQDTFTYTVSDSEGATDKAEVTIKIEEKINGVQANADLATGTKNSSIEIDVVANDTSQNGESLTITDLGEPEQGKVTKSSSGRVVYSPKKDYTGQDSFSYTVSDEQGNTDTAQVTVIFKSDSEDNSQQEHSSTTSSPSSFPTAQDDIKQVQAGKSIQLEVLANDQSKVKEKLTIQRITDPQHGEVEPADQRKIKYRANEDYSGQDSFKYTIVNSQGNTDTAQVKITVTDSQEEFTPADKQLSVTTGEEVTIDVLANNEAEMKAGNLSLQEVNQAKQGQVKKNSSGQITYVAPEDYQGRDQFTYTFSDQQGKVGTGKVQINIRAEIKLEMSKISAGTTAPDNGGIRLEFDIYMGNYEVTNQQFLQFLNQAEVSAAGRYKGKKIIDLSGSIKHQAGEFKINNNRGTEKNNLQAQPVTGVTWYGAVAYCNWLSRQQGLAPAYDLKSWTLQDEPQQLAGYRLPTEEEWKYAARGGSKGQPTTYAGSDQIKEVAWYRRNTAEGEDTKPVGRKAANELGLYDLSGNVWEWTGASIDSFVVRCGGSWKNSAADCQVTSTDQLPPSAALKELGFRVVRTKKQ